MKKAVAMKWIEALRSGRYAQERSILKGTGSFCCLGVLCDISNLGKWASTNPAYKPGTFYERGILFYSVNNSISTAFLLPSAVQDWAGLATQDGDVEFKKGRLSLVTLNDSRGRSFKQIAAYIERNWEKL